MDAVCFSATCALQRSTLRPNLSIRCAMKGPCDGPTKTLINLAAHQRPKSRSGGGRGRNNRRCELGYGARGLVSWAIQKKYPCSSAVYDAKNTLLE